VIIFEVRCNQAPIFLSSLSVKQRVCLTGMKPFSISPVPLFSPRLRL
jgi:hypothetical protein